MVEASSLLAMMLGGAEGRKPFPLSETEEREAFLEALRKAIDAHGKRAGSATSETLPYLPLALPQPDLPQSLQTFAVLTGRELPPALFTANPSVPGAAGPRLPGVVEPAPREGGASLAAAVQALLQQKEKPEAGTASELRETLSQAIRSYLEGRGVEGTPEPFLSEDIEPAPRKEGASLAVVVQTLLEQKEKPEAGTASELREALPQAIRSYLESRGAGAAGPRLPEVVAPAPREGNTSLAAALQALLRQQEKPEAGGASELRETLSQAIQSYLEDQGAEGAAGPRLPEVVAPAPREGNTSLAAALQALLQQKERPEAGGASELLRETLSQAIRSYFEDGGRKTEAMDAAQPLGEEAGAAAGKRSGFAETLGQRIAELVQAPHPEAGSQSASPNAPPFFPPAPAPAGTAPDNSPSQWLDRPLGHPAWDHALGEHVLRMTGKSLTTAELRLNPPDLGPLEVRIHLNQDRDQASIVFSSQHLAVREAVEAAIPKLREMFGNQQIHLVDVNVSQHSFSEQRRDFGGADDSGAPYAAARFSEETPMEDPEAAAGAEPAALDRLLNLYV